MENKQRKGDFKPKYSNAIDIQNDTTLLPGEKVRELVKHYAMCLFGLSSDMASAEQALKDKEIAHEATKADNVELRAKVKELENYADPQVKQELPQLRKKITMQQDLITALQKQIKALNKVSNNVQNDELIIVLKRQNKELQARLNAIKKERAVTVRNLTTEERQAIRADEYDKQINNLHHSVKYWQDKYNQLAQMSPEERKDRNKRIDSLTQRVIYWKNKANALEQENVALKERLNNG